MSNYCLYGSCSNHRYREHYYCTGCASKFCQYYYSGGNRSHYLTCRWCYGRRSIRITDTHVIFTDASFFSQLSDFGFNVETVGDSVQEFNSSEQFMVAMMARTSRDFDTLSEIMDLPSYRNGVLAHRIGAMYEGTMDDSALEKVVMGGNWYKFSQDEDLKNALIGTGDRTIVFSDPYDRTLGSGMRSQNRRTYDDPSTWPRDEDGGRALNILGEALMQIRSRLVLLETP